MSLTRDVIASSYRKKITTNKCLHFSRCFDIRVLFGKKYIPFTLWIRLPLSSLLGTSFCTAWSSIQLLDEYPTPRSLSVAICTEIGGTQPSAIHLTRNYTEFSITDIVHVRRSQANYPSWELLASNF